MESQVDNERGPGKNKRKWIDTEDEKLVEAMVDVLNSGSHFKSDNGFKPGFLIAVENRLAVLLPNSGIKAKPHIESRIRTLKSDWAAVHDMLAWNSTSGFGWDYTNNMLEAPHPVWKEYAKVNKNAAKWRGKSFPHYWELCHVFGKDRANGKEADIAADIILEMDKEQEGRTNNDNTQGNGEGSEDNCVDQPPNNPMNAPVKEESSIPRKRKRSTSWDSLLECLNNSSDVIGSKIEEATKTFNSVLGIERDREELRKQLHAEMRNVDGLTTREMNKAVRILSRDEDLVVIFFTVENKEKLTWVLDVLNDEA